MNTNTDQIISIAKRAADVARKFGKKTNAINLAMSLAACHKRRPLRLSDLEKFDDLNLVHDVFGIHRYLNRMTGELTERFIPRCGFES